MHKIVMVSPDQGYASVSTQIKPSIGSILQYKNNNWNTLINYSADLYPIMDAIKQKGQIYLWSFDQAERKEKESAIINFYNGRIWSEQSLPTFKQNIPESILDLALDDPENIWAVGKIGYTANFDGIQWSEYKIPNRDFKFRINAALDIQKVVTVNNENEAWACADGNVILHFFSGTWKIDTVFFNLSNCRITDMYFANENEGWAVSKNGYLFSYKNNRWQATQFNPKWNFNALKFFSVNNIWLAGDENNKPLLLQLKNNQSIIYYSITNIGSGPINDIDGFYFEEEKHYKFWIATENGIVTNTLPFDEVAKKYHLFISGRGGLFFDIDDDDDSDVFFLPDNNDPYKLLLNDDGYFEEFTFDSEVSSLGGVSSSAAFGDIDNDGRADIFAVNASGGLSLFHQQQALKFDEINIDVSSHGIIQKSDFITTRFWDYNQDGYVDIFVASNSLGLIILINDGYGNFHEIQRLNIPLKEEQTLSSITPYDINLDGAADIYIVYKNAENELWINDEQGSFSRVADPLYANKEGTNSIVGIFQDFNRDRWPDLYIYDRTDAGVIILNDRLYLASRDRKINFVNKVALNSQDNGIVAVADINHDFYPDLFISGGLFINKNGRDITDISKKMHVQFNGNPSWEDFDSDGDLDLLIARTPIPNQTEHNSVLLQNNITDKKSLRFKFNCFENNKFGIGSWIWIYKNTESGISRSEYCTGKYIGFEGNPLIPENYSIITIPVDEDIDYSAIVRFPSGDTKTYSGLRANRTFIISDLSGSQKLFAEFEWMLKFTLYRLNWLIELIKFIIIIVGIYWLTSVYKFIRIQKLLLKSILIISVLIAYFTNFITSGVLPYTLTHWSLFLLFPILIFVLPYGILVTVSRFYIRRIANYKTLKKLGEGGMSKVYKAKDTKNHSMVALKVLKLDVIEDKERVETFKREGAISVKLNHKNIIRIYETGIWNDQCYLVMELLEGETLSSLIRRKGYLPVKQIVSISIQLATALKVIHENKIIHRDIKSDNIFITKSGVVKLMDFDLARSTTFSIGSGAKELSGTLPYMSPQQAVGETIDHRGDIYSLGVVMYEMATGRLPFKGENDMAIIYEIFNTRPLSVSRYRKDFPKYIEKCILNAIAKETENRYQDVSILLKELQFIYTNLIKGYAKK